ncbi:MAG: hypothetical protein V7K49_24235 [Nostoc sp.]
MKNNKCFAVAIALKSASFGLAARHFLSWLIPKLPKSSSSSSS